MWELHVEPREKTGHRISRKLRRIGRIPAIFYGAEEKSIPVSVDLKEFEHLIHHEVNVLDVVFPNGEIRKSVIREVQRDPVTDVPIHVDLMGVSLTEKIRMKVPIVLKGVPVGVKEGGILEQLLREVEVEGLPLDLPEHIEIDVSHLEMGKSVTLEHVQTDKFRFVTDLSHPVATVILPKVVKEEVPVAAPEGGEEKPAEASGEASVEKSAEKEKKEE